MKTDQYFLVAEQSELEDEGQTVVSDDSPQLRCFIMRKQFTLLTTGIHTAGFHSPAAPSRRMSTCHWHHARFELEAGDTFDPWADDVQTFPVELRDGTIYLDPEPTVPRFTGAARFEEQSS